MDPDSVTITSTGRLGRGNVSSRRYKHDIKPIAEASEELYALKPVSFRFNKEYDPTQTLAFGLIAEEVAETCARFGRTQSQRPARVRPLGANQRDVAQRIPQRTSQSGGTRSNHSQTAKADRALSSGLDKVNAQLAAASLPLRTAGELEASKPGTRTASE